MSSNSVVYATFDRFPAPKGAATHIRAFVAALGEAFPPVELVTVAGPAPTNDGAEPIAPPAWTGVRQTELPAWGGTLVERVLSFRTQLRAWWADRRPQVAHVRSIYEGYPIARDKARWCQSLVFEVNGLPSIELKYHYPQVADDRELMQKLRAQRLCFLSSGFLGMLSIPKRV